MGRLDIPRALSSFMRTFWFGMAFPASYSFTTCCFSLIFYSGDGVKKWRWKKKFELKT